MKPGRGIFCPFRVNPRIFSGPSTRLFFPLCPPALLSSLFALPTVSLSFCIRSIGLRASSSSFLPSSCSFAFSMWRTFFLYSSFFPLFLFFIHYFFIYFLVLFLFSSRILMIINNSTKTISLHNFILLSILSSPSFILHCYV